MEDNENLLKHVLHFTCYFLRFINYGILPSLTQRSRFTSKTMNKYHHQLNDYDIRVDQYVLVLDLEPQFSAGISTEYPFPCIKVY